MKKRGFTLAEVLITLGIIGVIASITLPSLMTDTTSAQIGPKLAKAVSMFEQANESLLNANSIDALSDGALLASVGSYTTELSRYLKITPVTGGYLSKDGMLYSITISDANPSNTADPAYRQRVGNVMIDINGSSKPGEAGTDIFYFSFWNDGSLRPKGGADWEPGGETWQVHCPKAEDGTPTLEGYDFCAGHVFENNLKVLYR